MIVFKNLEDFKKNAMKDDEFGLKIIEPKKLKGQVQRGGKLEGIRVLVKRTWEEVFESDLGIGMQVTKTDGSEVIEENVTMEDFKKAFEDPETQSVALHKPGATFKSKGKKYTVSSKGKIKEKKRRKKAKESRRRNRK